MPRRREVPKRRIIPDPKFKDKLVSKFCNTLMLLRAALIRWLLRFWSPVNEAKMSPIISATMGPEPLP